jgi:ribose transport system permease protein
MPTGTIDGARRVGDTARAGARLVERYLVYLMALAVFGVSCVVVPDFTSTDSIRSLLVLTSILGIASLGQTTTIIVGGIDLSIAPMLGLSSVLIGRLATAHWSFALIAAILVLLGAGIGAFSGLFSYALRAPALIVTLAVGYLLSAAALEVNRGQAGGIVPSWISSSIAVNGKTFGLPVPSVVVVWVAATAVLVVLEKRLPLFRRLYASGMNPRAAQFALVRVRTVWALAFAFSGLAAVAAGVFLAGFSGGADVSVGDPYLFLTIAAVVVGGTPITGGRGSEARTMAGAFLITTLTTLLLGLNIGSNDQQVLLGGLIIGVVALYGRESHVRTRV